jgi:hypothetical protein
MFVWRWIDELAKPVRYLYARAKVFDSCVLRGTALPQ